jgi:zinc/manganese transport system substrate-binding protein
VRRRPAAVTAAALAAAALGLSGCGSSGGTGAAVTTTGDPAKCPGEVVHVVVSVAQWSDLARTLGGDCASVTTVLTSSSIDPHDYEPTPSDIAAFTDADVVLVNGAGYDSWATKAADTLDPRPAVLTVAEIAGEHGEEGNHGHDHHHDQGQGHGHGGNPHLWYSPDAVGQVATAVTAELSHRSPDAAGYFTERAEAWQADLRPYLDEIAAVRDTAHGRTYAATETVFDDMAAAVGLTDRTPEGYRQAVSNESEPSPGAIAAFESALADGKVDVLIVNVQTEGSVPDHLRTAAEKAGVPVVAVTESPPQDARTFVAWQVAQLTELSAALSEKR